MEAEKGKDIDGNPTFGRTKQSSARHTMTPLTIFTNQAIGGEELWRNFIGETEHIVAVRTVLTGWITFTEPTALGVSVTRFKIVAAL